MGINVYVIFDPKSFTKDDIVKIIEDEGYTHNFFFYRKKISDPMIHMQVADEIWTFGDVSELSDYKLALELGMDIWKMG